MIKLFEGFDICYGKPGIELVRESGVTVNVACEAGEGPWSQLRW